MLKACTRKSNVKGLITRIEPGTPTRIGTEFKDMIKDNGMEGRVRTRNWTGTPKEKSSTDHGTDMLTMVGTRTESNASTNLGECEVCGNTFKKRGIKIHQSRSSCGKILQQQQQQQLSSSTRKISKSEDCMTPEKNHSGTTVQKMKRVPFIVSQEYHNRNRKETIEEKAVPEKILHKPAETEQRMLEVKNSPKLKDEAKLVQKQVTKWFRRKPKDTGVEMEVIEDSKEEVVKEDTKVEKQEKSRSKRVTSKEDLQKTQQVIHAEKFETIHEKAPAVHSAK